MTGPYFVGELKLDLELKDGVLTLTGSGWATPGALEVLIGMPNDPPMMALTDLKYERMDGRGSFDLTQIELRRR